MYIKPKKRAPWVKNFVEGQYVLRCVTGHLSVLGPEERWEDAGWWGFMTSAPRREVPALYVKLRVGRLR